MSNADFEALVNGLEHDFDYKCNVTSSNPEYECRPGDFGHSMEFVAQPCVSDTASHQSAPVEIKEEEQCDELPTPYQTFIHQSKYARYMDYLGRRENWGETIDRYMTFFQEHLKEKCAYVLAPD